jgi:hypothetical protein
MIAHHNVIGWKKIWSICMVDVGIQKKSEFPHEKWKDQIVQSGCVTYVEVELEKDYLTDNKHAHSQKSNNRHSIG